MKKRTRIICLIIAAVFIGTTILSIVFSFAYAEGEDESIRGETVYVDAEADGTPVSIVSSVYISNPGAAVTIMDKTTLTNIKNVTGNEAPAIDGENATFNADGEDVCYQGTAEGELPFSVTLKYFLDGREFSPEDIAGKSGHVRIEVKTKNNLLRNTEIDGEAMQLYVPFSVICMMTLNASFTAVESDGAKISAQAGQITALSVLLPGMAENLDAEDGDSVRDSFAIEANTDCFELSSVMFIGMTGIVDENDLSGIDDVEGLVGALAELNDASGELYKGSSKLSSGASEYSDGVKSYVDGIGEASDGAGEISEGTGELSNAMKEYAAGAWELSGGIDELASAVGEAAEKAGEVLDPSAELDPATEQLIRSTVEGIVRDNADAIEQSIRDQIVAELEPSLGKEAAERIAAEIDIDLSNFELELTDEQINDIWQAMLSNQIVYELKAALDEMNEGLQQLSSGGRQIASGADTIAENIKKLASAMAELYSGLGELYSSGGELQDGANTIAKGMSSLTSGLRALSRDGLQKIVDETDSISISLSRKDALLALSDSYTSFTSLAPKPGDTVQFMLTTREIVYEKPIEPSEPAAAEVEEGNGGEKDGGLFNAIGDWFESLFEKIKGWFSK